jgi:hypothetical protein
MMCAMRSHEGGGQSDSDVLPAERGASPARSASFTTAGIVAVSIAAGVLCAVAGSEPVGASPLSPMLVIAAVAAVCFVGAAGSRGLLAWTVLVAGVSSLWLPGIAIGTAVFVVAHVTARPQSTLTAFRPESPYAAIHHAALAGVAINLSARSEFGWFFGASTIVALAICCVILIGGLLQRGTTAVRATLLVSSGLAVLAVGSTVTFGLIATTVADELKDGERIVREGMRLLGDADLGGAETALRQAHLDFAKADDRLGSPWGVFAAAVPVVAQHREAAVTVSSELSDLTLQVSNLLDQLGPDSLSVVDSQIDLDAVAEFAVAIEEIQLSLDQLDQEVQRVSNPWLASAVTERLVDLGIEIDEQRERADTAVDVVAQLPAMLGAEGERVYLMLFTTPAEARGLGGFAGNWAEITVDDGKLTLAGFGRSDELDNAAPAGSRTVTGPTDWLQGYGSFGFTTEPGGTVGSIPFKNITMSPLMSSTGQVVAELYPQSGGREVDGVFVADVYVLAELLEFSGPVEVPGLDRELDAANAAEFLLNEQYVLSDKSERVDLIEDVSRTVVDRLLEGTRLEPTELLRSLGPLAEQGRLAGWAMRTAEQDLLTQVGLAGTLLPLKTDDAVTVAFNNAAGSKIDYFMEASGRYQATVDSAGVVDGYFEVTLDNTAPMDGQPDYVIGNLIGQPPGTNQTYLSFFTALPASELTIDGVAADGYNGIEGRYFVTSALVVIPSGESRTVRVRVSGPFDTTDGYSLIVRSPPAVGSTPIEVELDVVDGAESRIVEQTIETAGARRVYIAFDAVDGS